MKTIIPSFRSLICFLLLGCVMPSFAAVWYVATPASGGSDGAGGTQQAPFATITHAIEQAGRGDEIRIMAGTYNESLTNSTQKSGKDELTIKGGYDSTWTRDLKNAQTFVIPPSNKLPCVELYGVKSNEVSGIVLTGGSYGVEAQSGGGFHRLTQLVITNNASCGVFANANNIVIASSLIARNKSTGVYCNVTGFYVWLSNCTLAYNKGNGENTAAEFTANQASDSIYLVNCIVLGTSNSASPWNVILVRASQCNYLDRCCFGNDLKSIKYMSTAEQFVYGRGTLFCDPDMNEDFTLKSTSRCNKAGRDPADLPFEACGEDLFGTAWNGAYDIGCIKSSFAKIEPSATYADTYVTVDGSDDADRSLAGNKFKTIDVAVRHTAKNGTCHVAEGIYDGPIEILADDITVDGAGKATIRGEIGTNYRIPGMIAMGNSLTIRGFAFMNAAPGLYLGDTLSVSNCHVEACTFRSCKFGIQEDYDILIYGNSYNRKMIAKSPMPKSKNRFSHLKFIGNETGIQEMNNCDFICDNSLFSGNTTAGIYDRCAYGNCQNQMINCTFAGNAEGYYVRGVVSSNGSAPWFYNSVFVDNTSHGVYAAYWSGKTITLKSVLFNGNGTDVDKASGSVSKDNVFENTDPGFVTSSMGPYHVTKDSFVFGKGVDYQSETGVAIIDDLDYVRRRASKVTLGCYAPVSGLMMLVR